MRCGDGAVGDTEKRIVAAVAAQDAFEPHLVAVGDENLSEAFVRNDADQLFDPLHVELVEDVVQQQDGTVAAVCGDDVVLREFQRDEERFLLSLGILLIAFGLAKLLLCAIVSAKDRKEE